MKYSDAGVDRAAAERAKERIKALAARSFNPSVLSQIGSFGGMFRPDFARFREPVLVASADGVGTKIKVAIAAGRHDTIGYDIVAHCVDDILVQGAVPLFFMDYVAFGRVDPERVEAVVSGVARACSELDCPLLGGETAEMPGTYAEDDYDLAGFIVGVVERSRALTGSAVRDGDQLLGLLSSGLHTNGYSLARRALFDEAGHAVDEHIPELGGTLAEVLLAPHRSYLAALEPLLEQGRIRALAHITGGGFRGNLPRVLPQGLGARIRRSSWQAPPIFRMIQRAGDVDDDEMYDTFNMGVGMVAVVAPDELHAVEHSLERRGEVCHVIGSVVSGGGVVLE